MVPWHRSALTMVAVAVYGFLYAPIGIVLALSLNSARHGLAWEGFTLHWYRSLLENDAALQALGNSLFLAAVSTIIATVLGTALALGLGRDVLPGQRWIRLLLRLPVMIPDIVMAVALLLFTQFIRNTIGLLDLGMGTMLLGHVTFQIPFVTLVVGARYRSMDPALEEAARDLGADRWSRFRHVTLPLLVPAVVAGALLAFAMSLDDFVVSFFTSGPGTTTLPILIHSSVRRGITPDIHALSSLLVIAAVTLTLAYARFDRTGRFGVHDAEWK